MTNRRLSVPTRLGIVSIALISPVLVLLAVTGAAAAANDFPAGPEQALVSRSCTQCHGADVVTSQHKSLDQWAETMRRMIAQGAQVPDAEFDNVARYLTKNFGRKEGDNPQGGAGFASYQAIPGAPVQVHGPENPDETPAFPEQTRAPYEKSAPFKITALTRSLHNPWGLALLPSGDILISERLPGGLRILRKDGALTPPLKGLSDISRVPEYGLLDVVLAPDYNRSHRIFLTFFEVVTPAGSKERTGSNTYVARATLDERAGSVKDVQVIFRTRPAVPTMRLGLKTGGRIAIDPKGNLFVSIGDRDDNGVNPWDVAQRLDTDLGKIIYITPDGRPVADNPFIGKPGVLPEIWAYGVRSPEGLAFEPGTGLLWETEHGPRGGDELNIIAKGKNYGWPVISYGIDYSGKKINNEGTRKDGLEQPVYYWDPVIAPSGLAFYRGSEFPDWKGSLFVGGLRGKVLVRLKLARGKVVGEEALLADLDAQIRDVRVGPDGAVYVLTQATGDTSALLRLTAR